MAEQHFTHLHLHSDFSLLDGAISLDKLIKFGKENNFKSLAITDHGNVFGAVKFFQKCKSAGIKPILGMEAYLTEDVSVKNVDRKYYHIILLVQNETGYKNLCKLISFAYQKGFYFKPRIDYAILKQHSEGLIVTSACLGGHIPQLLINGKDDEAVKIMDWFLDVFGRDRFYLEVQPEDQEEQKRLNAKLYEWSAKKNIELVATGDCHYVSADDREAHEVMLAIQTHDKITNPDRYTFGACRVHMRTTQEMLELFKDHPQAVWNTGKIADMCTFDFHTDKLFFPQFAVPDTYTPETYFTQECYQGLEALKERELFPIDQYDAYKGRLEIEMAIIIKMGFVEYFLVVSDFIKWARRNDVPVGPGRGSGAGSLVAWAMEITNVDPIKYNLLFERFLNPERISMPDFDIDFCIEGREKVIDYVRDKYGHDKVCQIITFGTLMAKGVIKDVARVLGFPFEDANAITNLITGQTLDESLEQEPRLKELIDNNPKAQHLFSIAKKLEGLTRHASKHAAGVVISPEPIDEVLPVYVPPKSTELVTQYAMTELESIGFLKMDFLGLKYLTLIKNTIAMIEQNHGVRLDMDKLPLDDPKAFQLLCAGKTSGVFQLESEGIKEVLRKLQPIYFEEIIAVNALYRPGPLGSGMVDDFIERRHGRQKVEYFFPELEPILQETYGVIVYQEQVMKIASAIAGYSLGGADMLRRAMGKKKPEEMAKQQATFLAGAQAKGFDTKKAEQLFDLMAYFAGYGFNKSHSTAYALIAYHTAYLKANYTAEFMASLISLESTHAEKMSFYLQEAKDMGLPILLPDINRSAIMFSVVNNTLLFGLQGIKNVGLAALEDIIQERQKKPFYDLLDFCKRIDLRTSNKRVIENLIYAGAFDSLPGSRAQKINELATIVDRATEHKQQIATGQMGLFQTARTNDAHTQESYTFQTCTPWSDKEKLEKEKEVIGFYLSAHPLDSYKEHAQRLACTRFDTLLMQAQTLNTNQEPVIVGYGIVKSRKEITTKKGDRMAFIQLEDTSASAEIILFPRVYKQVEPWLDEHHVFVVKGNLDLASQQKCKIKALEMAPLETLLEHWSYIQALVLHLPSVVHEKIIASLAQAVTKGKVSLEFVLFENGKKIRLKTNHKIAVTPAFLAMVEKDDIKVQLML